MLTLLNFTLGPGGAPGPAAISAGDLASYLAVGIALAAVAVGAYFMLRLSRPHERPRRPGRVRPRPIASPRISRASGSSDVRASGNGTPKAAAALRFKSGDGRSYALGEEPVVIGASSAICTIVLDGEGIAPEHARIWLRQRQYLLHHVGGLSRKTYVGGQEADWVVLEPGDEVTIGAHRLVFENVLAGVEIEPEEEFKGRREQNTDDDLTRMEAAVRELWREAVPASETAVGERSGCGKFKVHRRKEELAERVGGTWVKRGRTVVLER